ncbi:hypothetical protein C0J45_3275 [Silurus meridionalis]|nr:hypothetical protein C0J45_3275 [Silurus meridionalis]
MTTAATVGRRRRRRGGRRLQRQRKKKKWRRVEVQETKWKGSKTKLFYHGVDGKRNGVGVILKEEYSKSVVEVKRVSDRVMKVKLEVEGEMKNIISAYAPQMKKKRSRLRTERRIRWWKLKEEDCSVRFREQVRQGLGGGEEMLDDCGTTAEVIRETARKVLDVTSGNRKEDKEMWWWNDEVQESRRRKKLEKQNWIRQSDDKSRQEYKEMQQQNKGDVQTCSNYSGIKLISHTMTLWERVVEARLREEVTIREQQYGFMGMGYIAAAAAAGVCGGSSKDLSLDSDFMIRGVKNQDTGRKMQRFMTPISNI